MSWPFRKAMPMSCPVRRACEASRISACSSFRKARRNCRCCSISTAAAASAPIWSAASWAAIPAPSIRCSNALPPILHIRGSGTARSSWLKEFTRFAVMEASEKRAGGNGILSKLGELMFVELVRHYVETLPEDSRGWLGGLRDRHVGRALNLLHAEPTRDWTLDQLAKEVGLSRSSFAERFTGFVGIPPMQYLQKWRLQMAASQLSEGNASIAAIAAEIGYESEAAFSRAFKKMIGEPPAEWRSNRTAAEQLRA